MIRPILLRLGALGALLAVCGCVTDVRLAPRTFDWTWEKAAATWRSDGVTVVADLATEVGPVPVTGAVRTRDRGARIRFERPGASEDSPLGETRAGGASAPIVAGRWYDVEPASEGGGGSLSFALGPDTPWDGLPAEGATATYRIVVRTASGELACPYRFRVESSKRRLADAAMVPVAIVALPVMLILAVGAPFGSYQGGMALGGGGLGAH